ncbi:MAG: hypothetical protein ACXVB0_06770 [Mucilaginibacter sp.]
MLNSSLRPDAISASYKSDEELQYSIDNREKYLPESVEAALTELQNRGKAFSDEEILVINEDMQARRQLTLTANTSMGMLGGSSKNNMVEDPDAYSFYSRQVIRIFTFFFGALFGSIMMAINVGKTKNQNGVFMVILFGVAFTILQVFIVMAANLKGSSTGIIFGIAASFAIDYLFWDRYIGNETLYRAKPFWIPLIIALVLAAMVIIPMFYGQAEL